jgi:hypothetical protein
LDFGEKKAKLISQNPVSCEFVGSFLELGYGPLAVASGYIALRQPGLSRGVSKLRMCDLKKDLNAEDAEVFAKARREVPHRAEKRLTLRTSAKNLCALCV